MSSPLLLPSDWTAGPEKINPVLEDSLQRNMIVEDPSLSDPSLSPSLPPPPVRKPRPKAKAASKSSTTEPSTPLSQVRLTSESASTKRKADADASPAPTPTQKRARTSAGFNGSALKHDALLRCQRHSQFWYLDGSVLIQVEDTVFKLHRSVLARASPYFERLFKDFPDGNVITDNEAFSGCPIYQASSDASSKGVKASVDDFTTLLCAVEDAISLALDPKPYPFIASVLRASTAFSFPRQRQWAEHVLSAAWPADLAAFLADPSPKPHAAAVIRLANECNLDKVYKRAFYELLRTPGLGQIEELLPMPALGQVEELLPIPSLGQVEEPRGTKAGEDVDEEESDAEESDAEESDTLTEEGLNESADANGGMDESENEGEENQAARRGQLVQIDHADLLLCVFAREKLTTAWLELCLQPIITLPRVWVASLAFYKHAKPGACCLSRDPRNTEKLRNFWASLVGQENILVGLQDPILSIKVFNKVLKRSGLEKYYCTSCQTFVRNTITALQKKWWNSLDEWLQLPNLP